MTDYEDYENNLAFPPTTDRTQSTIEKLTEENKKLEQLLWECRDAMNNDEYWVQCDLIKQIDELLGEE